MYIKGVPRDPRPKRPTISRHYDRVMIVIREHKGPSSFSGSLSDLAHVKSVSFPFKLHVAGRISEGTK